jgi:hypothetical protein
MVYGWVYPLKWRSPWENHLWETFQPWDWLPEGTAARMWCQILHFLRRFCCGFGSFGSWTPENHVFKPGRRTTTAGLHFGPSGCVAWDSAGETEQFSGGQRFALRIFRSPRGFVGSSFLVGHEDSSGSLSMHWLAPGPLKAGDSVINAGSNALAGASGCEWAEGQRRAMCYIIIWCYMTYVLDRIYVLWQYVLQVGVFIFYF